LIRQAGVVGLVAIDEADHVHLQRYKAGAISAAVFARLAR
jgi:hypothetical protein